jgi:hypothetical protein
VLYSRDPVFNAAAAKIDEILLTKRPTPAVPIDNLTFDDGRIKILGVDFVDPSKPVKPGDRTAVYVYFEALDVPTKPYKFQLVDWMTTRATFAPDAAMYGPRRGPFRATLDGLFAANRWRKGELIRDRWDLEIPKEWTMDGLGLGLAIDEGKRITVDGPHPGGDQTIVTLGVLPIVKPPPVVPTPPPGPATPPTPPGTGSAAAPGHGSAPPPGQVPPGRVAPGQGSGAKPTTLRPAPVAPPPRTTPK